MLKRLRVHTPFLLARLAGVQISAFLVMFTFRRKEFNRLEGSHKMKSRKGEAIKPPRFPILPGYSISSSPCVYHSWKNNQDRSKKQAIIQGAGLVKNTWRKHPILAPSSYAAFFPLQPFIPHPGDGGMFQLGIIGKKSGDIKHGDQQRSEHQQGYCAAGFQTVG